MASGESGRDVALLNYVCNLVFIWVVLWVYTNVGYYQTFIREETLATIYFFAVAYTVVGLAATLFYPYGRVGVGHGLRIVKALWRITSGVVDYVRRFPGDVKVRAPSLTDRERTSILFALVKFFYIPIMLNFLFGNYHDVANQLGRVESAGDFLTTGAFNNIIFPFGLSFFLLIDTLYFSFGYLFEAEFLKSKVRSVEPTLIGWVVALVCYPPFNGLAGRYVPWYANDFVQFWSPTVTLIARAAALFLFWIYLWATLALGTKSSNLTNRGIVSTGPYAHIRHPAYISKNLAWWLTIIPVINLPAIAGMTFWSVIYFLRAVTEERHLIRDPDYRRYCKKVKYRFIPGVV
ncbi:MAG: isoprenylcysteine carboxylmethyltransferase family protein [Candidatus Altiarchaeota archaeon]